MAGTIDKALKLLALFSSDEPQWTVEEAATRLGIPTSTAYRYFRSLTHAGLIVDFTSGRYVIGPGIIEFDRIARRSDPLILAARSAMDDLASIDPERNVVLLSRLYRRRVMCVDRRSQGHHPMTISYERGRPMPLYRGSVSKVILARLNARAISSCYAEDADQIAQSGLGGNLREFRETLRGIRRGGTSISFGEIDKGVIGISAPVAGPDGEVFASIALVIPDDAQDPQDPHALAPLVARAAHKTEEALKSALGDPAPSALPPADPVPADRA